MLADAAPPLPPPPEDLSEEAWSEDEEVSEATEIEEEEASEVKEGRCKHRMKKARCALCSPQHLCTCCRVFVKSRHFEVAKEKQQKLVERLQKSKGDIPICPLMSRVFAAHGKEKVLSEMVDGALCDNCMDARTKHDHRIEDLFRLSLGLSVHESGLINLRSEEFKNFFWEPGKSKSFRPDLVLGTAEGGRGCYEGDENKHARGNYTIEEELEKNESWRRSKSCVGNFMLRVGHPSSTQSMTEAELEELMILIENATALAMAILEKIDEGSIQEGWSALIFTGDYSEEDEVVRRAMERNDDEEEGDRYNFVGVFNLKKENSVATALGTLGLH